MILGWLAIGALAGPEVTSETVLQARHDLFGDTIWPFYQYLHLTADPGSVAVDGYLGFEPAPDGGAEGLRVYALNAAGSWAAGDWRVGTQTIALPMHPQTLDGGALRIPLSRDFGEFRVAAGWARHHDLDDLGDGIGLGRAEWLGTWGGWAVRAGAQAELFGDGAPVGRQDAEVRLGDPKVGELAAMAQIAEPWGGGVEWARGEGRLWVGRRVELLGYVERRETLAETLLADDILLGIARSPMDDVGGRLRWIGPRRGSIAAGFGAGRYWPGEDPVGTYHADLSWLPAEKWLPPVDWRFRQGPGGAYHAVSSRLPFDLGIARISPRGAVIPYQRGEDVWRVAGTAGTDVAVQIGEHVNVAAGGDLASDAVWALDLRAHGVLTLVWP